MTTSLGVYPGLGPKKTTIQKNRKLIYRHPKAGEHLLGGRMKNTADFDLLITYRLETGSSRVQSSCLSVESALLNIPRTYFGLFIFLPWFLIWNFTQKTKKMHTTRLNSFSQEKPFVNMVETVLVRSWKNAFFLKQIGLSFSGIS